MQKVENPTFWRLLFAALAGEHLGLDGLRTKGAEASRRALLVLAGVATVVGLVALVVVADRSFTARQGGMVGWAHGELKLLWFNPLSALLTLLLGLALGAAALRRIANLAFGVAAVFGVMALQVIVQWRYNKGAWTGGVLGGTGATMAFWAALAVGTFVCARRARPSLASSTIDQE